MLPSYPSCNIHLILKFYVRLKYIRTLPSAVLQKDENLDGLGISQGADGCWNAAFHGDGLIFRGWLSR